MSTMSELAAEHDLDEVTIKHPRFAPGIGGTMGVCRCGYETPIFRGRSRLPGGAYTGVDADLAAHLFELTSTTR